MNLLCSIHTLQAGDIRLALSEDGNTVRPTTELIREWLLGVDIRILSRVASDKES